MKSRSYTTSGSLLLLLLVMAGCASPGPYRTVTDPASTSDRRIVEPDTGAGYCIGYVEFDEQGWFWMPFTGDQNDTGGPGHQGYREQMRAVQDMVKKAAHFDISDPMSTRGIILVAFVHGWENNAAPGNDNVLNFKKVLGELAKKERKDNPNPREVVGVYIGWPGLSVTIPWVQSVTTFYTRKDTGDRVGLYGGVTEVLSRLEALSGAINQNLSRQPVPGTQSYYVVVGHSFGAQVVYGSAMQVMTQRLAEWKIANYVNIPKNSEGSTLSLQAASAKDLPPEGKPMSPFGDLVVLINPAFEGERFFNLRTFAMQWDYPDDQRPVLAIFQAENDTPTHIFFPIGRFFSTFFERYRSGTLHDLQWDSNHLTVPWTDEFVTHCLSTVGDYIQKPESHGVLPPQLDWNGVSRLAPWQLEGCVMAPNPRNRDPWSPFYVVRVDPKLIDNHNGIWMDQFRYFLESFIAKTDAKSAVEAARPWRNMFRGAPAVGTPMSAGAK